MTGSSSDWIAKYKKKGKKRWWWLLSHFLTHSFTPNFVFFLFSLHFLSIFPSGYPCHYYSSALFSLHRILFPSLSNPLILINIYPFIVAASPPTLPCPIFTRSLLSTLFTLPHFFLLLFTLCFTFFLLLLLLLPAL